MVQAVAVALLLGVQHDLAQGLGGQELLLTAAEDLALEGVSGIDVADDLGHILELGLDEGQLLFLIGGVCNGGVHDDALVEGGSGLRQGHGVVPVQGPLVTDAPVVECVAQLMGQGDDGAEEAVEIGQDAALAQALRTGTEGAAGLAVSGVEVDPGVVKGLGDHIGHLLIEGGELAHQIFLGLLQGELGGCLAHGGKNVVPGQAVFIAEGLGLGLQVLPEHGQVLVNGAEHGIQRLLLHVGALQGAVQGTFVATQAAVVDGLQLDGVQSVSDGIFHGLVAGKLRLVSCLADSGIVFVGQVSDSGQVDDAAVVGHLDGAGQVTVEVRPGIAAGQLHLGHDLLATALQQVLGAVGEILKEELVIFQVLVTADQFHQIGDLGGPGIEGGLRTGGFAAGTHDTAQLRSSGGVPAVSFLTQGCVQAQLVGQIRDLFPVCNATAQTLQGLGVGQIAGEDTEITDL